MKTFDFAYNYVKAVGISLLNLDVPIMKCKSFSIKEKHYTKGTEVAVISERMSFLTGKPICKVKLKKDWDCLELYNRSGTKLMSSHPIEVFTHLYPALVARGRVLVGGLGLGLVLKMMESNSRIDTITCVENRRELVKVFRLYYPNVKFHCSDIFKYLENTTDKYDFIYLDTWSSTGEAEFYRTVLPLRYYAGKRLNGTNNSKENIVCWMEEEMRGQVINAIHSRIDFAGKICNDAEIDLYWNPVVYAFFNEYSLKQIKKMSREKLGKLVNNFVNSYEY